MSSFRKSITIRRVSGGAYVGGRYVEGTVVESTIQASVQPINKNSMSKIIELLPEGRRQDIMFRLYTSTKLNALQNSQNPDVAVINGVRFEVIAEDEWQNNVINHYVYIVVKVKE